MFRSVKSLNSKIKFISTFFILESLNEEVAMQEVVEDTVNVIRVRESGGCTTTGNDVQQT